MHTQALNTASGRTIAEVKYIAQRSVVHLSSSENYKSIHYDSYLAMRKPYWNIT
jgi:hypothetical protein